jgi:hypothetical protein
MRPASAATSSWSGRSILLATTPLPDSMAYIDCQQACRQTNNGQEFQSR